MKRRILRLQYVYNLHLEVQVCAGRRLDYTMTAEMHTKLECLDCNVYNLLLEARVRALACTLPDLFEF